MYERSALILDLGTHHLAPFSLALIGLGHRPLYATDLDELVLLARERKEQVGAVVLPAARALALLPDVRRRIVEPLGLALACVLSVGDRLDAAEAAALHELGLRWTLREPFSFAELRFAVSHALAAADPNDFRLESRIPCSIPVDVEADGESVRACITDLSTSGAFVQSAKASPEGSSVVVRGQLPGTPRLAASARGVAHR
jgi:hypothetical protein